jgi:hypothetical protein
MGTRFSWEVSQYAEEYRYGKPLYTIPDWHVVTRNISIGKEVWHYFSGTGVPRKKRRNGTRNVWLT